MLWCDDLYNVFRKYDMYNTEKVLQLWCYLILKIIYTYVNEIFNVLRAMDLLSLH